MQPATVAARDSAYAADLKGWSADVCGYLPAPRAYHVWSDADWAMFLGNRKLPIWVAGLNGEDDAFAALKALFDLRVPRGTWVALDLESRVDKTYVARFGAVMDWAGYWVAVYGSASTVFGNPPLDGYWVADWTGQAHLYPHDDVVGTQYASGQQYDSSLFLATVGARFWQ